MESNDETALALLRRLADALGVSVEQFFAGSLPLEAMAGVNECLRLWSDIRTQEGRRQALEALRVIVEREEA